MGLTWRPETLPVCLCHDRDTLVPFWKNLVTGGLFVNPVWNTPVFELRVGLTIQGGVNFPRLGLYPSSELCLCNETRSQNE